MEYPKSADEARRIKDEFKNSKRIERMHLSHGAGPAGRKCRECEFLILQRYGRVSHKCQKYGISNTFATDWQEAWPACGKYEGKQVG